jgi:hypothetical protein
MEILIKENAADNYFRRCYKGTRPDAVGLHNEGFYNILKGLQGKWVEVETTHLFSNQFNTVPVEGVTGSGARINMEDVEEIKDDVRHGVYKCVWCMDMTTTKMDCAIDVSRQNIYHHYCSRSFIKI